MLFEVVTIDLHYIYKQKERFMVVYGLHMQSLIRFPFNTC